MRSRLQSVWGPAALFLLNAYLCHRLFTTEYTVYRGSIESTFIGISRYLLDHPFSFGWFPAWYTGIPFQNTYPPLLEMLVAAVAWIGHISPALSYHAVTAAMYSLGPVCLYALGVRLGAGRLESFGAGLLYSLFSLAAALSTTVHAWAGPPWHPSRLQALLVYGEGPHVTAMTLLPLAIIALHWALTGANGGTRRAPLRTFLAALAMAAVVLTNWLGAVALALGVISYLLARSRESGWWRTCARAAGIAVGAYILAAPWIPPSTIANIQRNSQNVEGLYPTTPLYALYWAVVAVVALILRRVLLRARAPLATSFVAFFFLFTAAIVLPNDWPGIYLVPQPHRYQMELEMAACGLLAFTLIPAARRTRPAARRILAVLAILLAAVQFNNYRKFDRALIQPFDIRATVEYQEAAWLRQNLPGGRVFLAGSSAFWLNVFADTAQVGGGFDQATVNSTIPMVHFGIPFVPADGEKMATWLRLYGVGAVATSGPQGRDAYRDWKDAAKFNGILPELWRDGDDAIFGVPQRSASLAHVIRKEDVVRRTPVNILDLDPVSPLAAALENPSLPLARFDWTGAGHARITADMAPDQILFVQVAYHHGWHASASGREVEIARDGLGFMVLEPACTGACEVVLTYDGGVEMSLARLSSGTVFLGWLSWFVWPARGFDRKPLRLLHSTPFLAALALLLLNVFVCWRLFFIEHIIHFGSVEPVFFAMAKAIRERWPGDWFDLGWWAQSSVGTPFAYTYQPLLHHVVAATAALSSWSEARAYHVVLATFYSFGPVTLFALALRLTRSVGASFSAGLLYTFLSPSAFLIPLIAVDMGSPWFARRLHTATVWGDGPNMAGLTLLPLAILFLDRARQRRTPGSWALAAIFIISVPLTNIPAAIALAMALVAYALACDVRVWPKASLAIAAAALGGFALFAVWLPPSSLILTATNAQWMSPEGRFTLSKLPYYLLFAASALLLRLLLTRVSFAIRFAALFAFLTAGLALPAAWFHFNLIGQAERLHVAMEIPIILTMVLVGSRLVKWTRGRNIALAAVLAVICLVQLGNHWTFAKNALREGDVRDRAEFKIARWMDANAGSDRIYAPGAVSLWFNYLARQPQLIGCCDQNLLMPIVVVAHYVLGSDDGAGDRAAEISIAWLQVMGVHYAAVNGPLSNEPYKDFRHPEKFNGILKEVWRDGDDVIYEVPLASPSLAHVVRPDELIASVPENGLRIEPMEKYRAAVLDRERPQAEFTWTSTRDALIHGTLPAGSLYSLQIPYHAGWRADPGVRIAHDALGFMTVEPQCTGPCDVHLHFDGGTERTALRWITLLAWLGLAAWAVWAARQRRMA